MTTIDNRVVEMGFDNKKFGQGVSGTLSMLDKLKNALHLSGASKGLQDINAAAGKFDANPMVDGVGRIAGQFTALQAVAFGALANIGAKISNMAIQMGKSFTIEPITQGFQEYETNMNSIQTILANTSAAGTTLGQVNTALDEMNHYSDQTIYNFSEMAKNVGTFTAAGVDLDTATGSIKGIANLAALSGSNSQQAAGAMYQLSQEIAAGKVTLMGWNSVVNAGMGGTVFQRALAETAVAMGKIDKSALTLKGDMKNVVINGKAFRDSISAEGGQESWLTSDVLTNTLQQFTGDLNDAELQAQGFNQAQIEAIKKQAAMAKGAATEVKTFTGLMDTLKEGVASGWSSTFRTVIGDFEESKKLFTSVSNAVGGFFSRASDARNEMLSEWKELGGRTALIEGLTDMFWAFAAPIAQLGMAFREVFPKSTAQDLFNATTAFRDFFKEIQPSNETLDRLKRTFAGLFAVVGILWELLKAGLGFIRDLFLGFTEGDQGILRFTASIGDFLVGLHKAIKEGQGFTKFFDKLKDLIFKLVNPIRDFGQILGKAFEGIDTGALGGNLGKLVSTLFSFGEAGEKSVSVFDRIKSAFSGFLSFFGQMATAIADFVSPITDTIKNAFGGMDAGQVMEGVQTGLLGGLVLVIKQLGGMFKGFSIFQNDLGFVDKIKEAMDNITGTLSAMQANLKASMLLKIAGAIALLAVSVVLLAGVDGPGLARATAALTVMFIQLGAAMMAFQKIGTVASMAKLTVMGAALILLATAILILSAAVKVLASLSWQELAKGLLGLTVIIGVLIAASKGIDKQRGAILRSAASLILLGFAVKNLVAPIKDLGSMDWDVLKQGLIGVGGLLVGLAIFTRLAAANKGGVLQSAGLLILSFAIAKLAESVEIFGTMKPEMIVQGFTAMGTGITVIGMALKTMPKSPMVILTALALGKVAGSLVSMAEAFKKMEDITWESIAKGMIAMTGIMALITAAISAGKRVNPIQSAALYIVASAVAMLGKSLISFGNMDYDEIGKGLLAMGGALAIMATTLQLMSASGTGAAALVMVAAALAVITPVLLTLGSAPLLTIVGGLFALAGIFAILGVAGLALTPVVPTLMALGIALGVIGAAMFLAGAGLALFAVGLTALAASGAAGVTAIVAIVSGLAGLIPMIAKQIGLGIVEIIKVIGNSAVQITRSVTQILVSIYNAIIATAPKFGAAMLVLLKTGLTVLVKGVSMLVDAGMKLILGLLRGIGDNIGKIVDAAADIIVNFLDGISRNIPRIIQSGIDLILSFVNGLADGIRNNSAAMGEAGGNLASAIVEGMINGLVGGTGKLVEAAKEMAKKAWNAAKEWLGIASPSKKFAELGKFTVQGFLKGLKGGREDIRGAVHDMFGKLNDSIASTRENIKKEEAKLKEIWKDRKENMRQVERAHEDLAKAHAKEVGSTAKTASARNAEIKRESEARNNAIRNAEERVRKLTNKWIDYDRAINKSQRAIYDHNAELNKMVKARTALSVKLLDERQKLDRLGASYDLVSKKLEAGMERLKEAIKIRDDYNKSINEQYGDLPEFDKDTKLKDYVKDFEKKIIDTQKFTIAIMELRKRGLNDEMYKELMAKGPEAMPFLQEILAGGYGAVKQLNTLGTALDRDADRLADRASVALYQAGVNAAKGLVNGLRKEQAAIDKQMERIATYMVEVMKKKLQIKSPSRVFAELGKFTGEGVVQGLDSTIPAVTASAERVGQSAIDGMTKTISGLGAMIESDIDAAPVITPVLDLSDIRKNASGIATLLSDNPLNLGAAYANASNASVGYNRNAAAAADLGDEEGIGGSVVFNQYNSSPKPLNEVDLYRQTKSQLSTAKGALTTT